MLDKNMIDFPKVSMDIIVNAGEARNNAVDAIDNLMKGASGQAVQNMNVRFGFKETSGLNVFGDL